MACGIAGATALGFSNTSGAYAYQITTTPPNPITKNPNNGILLVWNEVQNYTLQSDLAVDRVADANAPFVKIVSGKYYLKAGTIVSSHYVQWDPGNGSSGTVNATMHFDSDIFAFITADQKLFDSDAQLGLPGLNYNDFTARGLESGDTTNMSGSQVTISWAASDPGDWTRLLTAFSPTAAPTISANSVNFGNVLVGSSKNSNITVTNTGGSGSTLTGTIYAAPSGTEFSPSTGTVGFSLGQNQSQSRTFTYAPTQRGYDAANVSINSNDANITRTLQGTGVAAVNQVTSNNISTTRIGTTNTGTISIKNIGDGNLSGLGETSNLRGTVLAPTGSSAISGNGVNVSLTDGSTQTLSYQYTPTTRGTDSASVQINFANGNTNGSNTSQSMTTNFSALAVSPEYVSSVAPGSVIDFGVVEAYSSNQYVLRIQNLTPDADLGNLTNLTLLSATISGIDSSYFSIQNFTPHTVLGKNAYIDLIITATNPEWRFHYRNATLTILTDQNAAFGSAGQSFTYTLTALCVPEPTSWLMIFLGLFGIGIPYKKSIQAAMF